MVAEFPSDTFNSDIPPEGAPKIPTVVETDNPMLEKFQTALRKHLLRVKNELETEISGLDHSIRELETEREEVGSTLYDLQREIENQNVVLDNYTNQIRDAYESRIDHERNARHLKKECEALNKDYKNAKRLHEQRLVELDNLQLLQNNITKWKEEMRDELETSKRIVGKNAQDKLVKSDQQKKMNFILFKLDAEVREREEELRAIKAQISEQNSNMETLNRTLADANIDLDALKSEQKHLYSSWNEVIIATQARDKTLANAKDSLAAEQFKQKELQTKIDGTKREAAKEMQQNELLENQRTRLSDETIQLNRQMEKTKAELTSLTEKVEKFDELVKQTEISLAKSTSENHLNESKLNGMMREIERQSMKNQALEENKLELLQSQITTDQISKNRARDLRETQAKRRDIEAKVCATEHQLAEVLFELERLKGVVSRSNEHLEELKQERQAAEQKANEYEAELESIKKAIEIKFKALDAINKELAHLVEMAGGFEKDPIELKISELERNIRQTEAQNNSARNDWLRFQRQLCELSEERTKQLNEIYLAKKHISIIEQKTLKIDWELDNIVKEDAKVRRETKNLLSKLDILNGKLYEKKKNNEQEKSQCETAQIEITSRLKDAEMQVVKRTEELRNLEKEIEETKLAVLEKHREALSWERKWKMVTELKKQRDEEYAKTSEIGIMKAEIHRMEVRYAQLTRAQEKLVQDMEKCVQHRDNIYDSASIREKLKDSKPRSRNNVQQRINELKGKLKQTEREIKAMERQHVIVLEENEHAVKELEKLNQCVESERMQDALLRNEIEQAILLKQGNLENIVRMQQRAKRYRNVAVATQLPKIRTENAVDHDMEKHNEINLHLISVLEELLTEFPDHKFRISKVLQTLKG